VSDSDVPGSIRGGDVWQNYFVGEIFDDEIRVLTPAQKDSQCVEVLFDCEKYVFRGVIAVSPPIFVPLEIKPVERCHRLDVLFVGPLDEDREPIPVVLARTGLYIVTGSEVLFDGAFGGYVACCHWPLYARSLSANTVVESSITPERGGEAPGWRRPRGAPRSEATPRAGHACPTWA